MQTDNLQIMKDAQSLQPTSVKEGLAKLTVSASHHWFQAGQIVELNGNLFRISKVKPHELTLKLTKRAKP